MGRRSRKWKVKPRFAGSNYERDVFLSCGFVGVLLTLFTLWQLGYL